MNKNRLQKIRHVAIDLDGTIYTDGTVFPESLTFLKQIEQLGIGHTFLTNNASKSSREYVSKLSQMGIEAQRSQIYSSAHATIEFLKKHHPQFKKIFLVGTNSLADEFSDAGFEIFSSDNSQSPDAVVVSFDPDLKFSQLCKASYWITQQVPYFATHPDWVCPTNEQMVLLDCGSICAAIGAATGRNPDEILGKPSPEMLYGILSKNNLQPSQLAMIGDRLYTDIVMANSANVLSVLVLTGESTRDDVQHCNSPPQMMVDDIACFGKQLADAYREVTR